MDPADRKVALLRSGIKQVEIADKLGVSRTAVSRVISGERKSKRIRIYIARRLKMRVQDLWPPPDGMTGHGREDTRSTARVHTLPVLPRSRGEVNAEEAR